MTAQQHEIRLKEQQEENELLLLQLHQVQEELERYFLKCQALEAEGGVTAVGQRIPVDDQLPEALAEVARLIALGETQKQLRNIESANALNARIGDIVIQSVTSPGKLIGLPVRLLKIWRESEAKEIPAALGGKTCDKVIAAYEQSAFEGVAKLLAPFAAPSIKANAYTALARHLMPYQPANAAQAARLAYEEDPRPYRLKWLAFRIHEAGNAVEADAMLSLLPEGTQFSDSEARQVSQVRYEASLARLGEARRKTDFDSRRNAFESQLKQLAGERDSQANLAEARGHELEALTRTTVQLDQERASFVLRTKMLETQLETSSREMDGLKGQFEREEASLRQQRKDLETRLETRTREVEALQVERAVREEESAVLLQGLHQAQEELERYFLDKERLREEKRVLKGQLDEAAKETEERRQVLEAAQAAQARWEQDIASLTQTNAELARERMALAGQLDVVAKEAEARLRELEGLRLTQAPLEQERTALAGRLEESEKEGESRGREIERLKEALAQLVQEKTALVARLDASTKASEVHGRELDGIRAARIQLEQEKTTLAARLEEATKASEGHVREIEGLRAARSQLDQEKTTLAARLEEATKASEVHGREIEGLRAARTQLEQEKTTLAARLE
ncbi:MAG: hypothetical protein JNM98_16580, partial [Rhodocyclaceae bacterium]|nr:hypothetical protein [Rhodocyclaceae bacterium]